MNQAPEHVEIVDNLMLGTEQHRPIFTSTILLTGVLSMAVGITLTLRAGRDLMPGLMPIESSCWLMIWLETALACLLSAVLFASIRARRSRKKLNSPGLRHVLRSLLPALVFGAIASTTLALSDSSLLPFSAATMIATYGIALLCIRLYATRSVRALGIIMLALGCTFCIVSVRVPAHLVNGFHLANFFLTLAFGVFHLIAGIGSLMLSKLQR